MHFKSEQLRNGMVTHFIEEEKTYRVIFIADSIKTIWTWPGCFQEQSHGPVHFPVFSSPSPPFLSMTWARNCRAMIMSQLIGYRSEFWIPTEQEFHIQALHTSTSQESSYKTQIFSRSTTNILALKTKGSSPHAKPILAFCPSWLDFRNWPVVHVVC